MVVSQSFGLLLLAAACLSGAQAGAATFVVSNVNDSGAGSLRQAILDSNATNGPNVISFQIAGSGVKTIAPVSALPPLITPVVLDGTTQSGYSGSPLIELNGANTGTGTVGLRVQGSSNTIRGLVINSFGAQGLLVQGAGRNIIQGNFIGTDASGTVARPNTSQGIYINGSSFNTIGGTNAAERNLISGNGTFGLYADGSGNNLIWGNYIGTTAGGNAALGNANSGINISACPSNIIGGTVAGARNIISGNKGRGIYIDGTASSGNVIQGNYIGLGAGGLPLGNGYDGITLNSARNSSIGGTNAGAGNWVSGNANAGIALVGGAAANQVQGNWVGTDVAGRLSVSNLSGVVLYNSTSNVIGGTVPEARNVVSGNKFDGLQITNSIGTVVAGNFIGVDATGTNLCANFGAGVTLSGASANLVGGTVAGARNVISGNTNGVVIVAKSTNNLIQGNYIGTDVNGQKALANRNAGVHVESAGNTIGGTLSGAGNLISGNATNGVEFIGAGASNNLVQGNFIGTKAGGRAGLGNGGVGVGVSGAPGNTIGGTVAGAMNLISANAQGGMYLVDPAAAGNLVQGNFIGTDVTGTVALGNGYEGIYMERAVSNTIGGIIPEAMNVISANGNGGMYLINASGNVIQGNYLGTKLDGVSDLGNGVGFHVIELEAGCNNNIIGGSVAGAGNRIAFAKPYSTYYYSGVRVRDGSVNNLISGNAIFSNSGLAIDLSGYLLSANDSCDLDTGANQQQNFPVLTQAVSGNGTGVRGTLNSTANTAFRLQFFANPACDSLGNGEGQIFLGEQTILTGGNCTTSFGVDLPVQVPAGYVITATATDPGNNTSEFSSCVSVQPGTPPCSLLLQMLTNTVVITTNTCQVPLPDLTGTNYVLATTTCSTNPVSLSQLPQAGYLLSPGVSTVTVAASDDAGHSTNCSISVVIQVPPNITMQPSNAIVAVGSNASFSVTACGSGPVSYQWRRSQTNIPSATNAVLILPQVSTNDIGDYTVLVSNAFGATNSVSALLAILQPPVITAHPQSCAAVIGGRAAFSVAVDGVEPLHYQWRTNGLDILNGTNATLTIPNVQSIDFCTNYTVLITNRDGWAVSSPATLSLARSPSMNALSFNLATFWVSFDTEIGPVYVVEYKNRLDETNWHELTSVNGTGGTIAPVTDNNLTNAFRFYRVRVR